MILKRQFFTFLLITLLLYIENSEAWNPFNIFGTTTTTTVAPYLLQQNYRQPITTPTKVGGPIVTATNTATSSVDQQGPAIDAYGAQQNVRNNARPNRPNPGTEVGQDFISRPNRPGTRGGNGQIYQNQPYPGTEVGQNFVPGPNRPGTSGGNGQTYQNRPYSGTEVGQDTIVSRPNTLGINGGNGQTYPNRPNLPPDFRQPSNIPTNIQPTQPSVTGSRNMPQPTPTPVFYGVNILTPYPPGPSVTVRPAPRPVTPVPSVGGLDQYNPNNQYNPSNEQWSDVVAGGTRRSGSSTPTGLPRRPEYSGENEPQVTPGTPTRPGQFPNRPTSPGVAVGPAAGAATGASVVYSSNPTYSKGNTVTNEDLEKLSEALYIKDKNNANRYVTVNLQGQTTSSNPTDQAPQPILTVNPEAFQISTIREVLSIFDNYHLDTLTHEVISPAQREEESHLVDTFLSTNVMAAAMNFLAKKGFVKRDYYEYKALLRQLWFDLFSRGQGRSGSSGFEHVFMAETKQVNSDTDVLGLHNWIFFNAEETKNLVDYLGYIKKIDLGNKGSIVKMHAKFNGHDKPVTTVFIGTSPELEMALYTVCFYARPDGNCPVSLGGTKFNIVTKKFKYRGKDLIGTAYPDI